jgi:transcriptional regulator with XRE-family HTH domain
MCGVFMEGLGDLGGAVRRRRQVLGFSQAALADRVGLSQQAITQIEAGGGVRPAHFVSICDALDTRAHDLLLDAMEDPYWPELDPLLVDRVMGINQPTGCDAFARSMRRLIYAEERRRRGFPREAEAEADAVIARLRPLIKQNPHDVELAALLLEAHDLRLAAGVHACDPESGRALKAICRDMIRLARERLPHACEAEARAILRLADICRVVSGPDIATGLDASERCAALARDPILAIEGLRARAGMALLAGNLATTRQALNAMRVKIEKHGVNKIKVATFYQSIAWTLATMSFDEKRAGLGVIAESERIYNDVRARGYEEPEVEAMILRSKALIAATPGPGSDLDLARVTAESGRGVAEAAGRTRLVRHCELVLTAADARQPLQGVRSLT